jgi:Flp pilus assembly protein TadG
MNDWRNKGRWKRGSSAVEFALALPVFIILVIGIIEFGWYFFVQHTLQFATREGMRLALVGRTLTDASGNPMTRQASIIQTIKDHASAAVKADKLVISIYPVNNDFSNPANWQNMQNPGGPGDYMRVQTSYDHNLFTPLIGSLFSGRHVVVHAQGTYRNETFD